MSRWWRAYDEAVDDPKLIALSDAAHRAWFNILCLSSANGGVVPSEKILKIKLRLTQKKLEKILDELRQNELLDTTDEGQEVPHNWRHRQYKSDCSTPRVKRFRETKRNVSETPPEYRVQSTDTEKKDLEDARASRDASAREKVSRGTRLPNDWQPSDDDLKFAGSHGLRLIEIEMEATKFRNYWTAKAGRDATKLDWSRTWQNWILNGKGRGGSNGRVSSADRARELADKARELERQAGFGGPVVVERSH